MKKIMKALKWYFSHLNLTFTIGLFVILVIVSFLDNPVTFMWMWGYLVLVLVAPVMGILRTKQLEDIAIKQQEYFEAEKQKTKGTN